MSKFTGKTSVARTLLDLPIADKGTLRAALREEVLELLQALDDYDLKPENQSADRVIQEWIDVTAWFEVAHREITASFEDYVIIHAAIQRDRGRPPLTQAYKYFSHMAGTRKETANEG